MNKHAANVLPEKVFVHEIPNDLWGARCRDRIRRRRRRAGGESMTIRTATSRLVISDVNLADTSLRWEPTNSTMLTKAEALEMLEHVDFRGVRWSGRSRNDPAHYGWAPKSSKGEWKLSAHWSTSEQQQVMLDAVAAKLQVLGAEVEHRGLVVKVTDPGAIAQNVLHKVMELEANREACRRGWVTPEPVTLVSSSDLTVASCVTVDDGGADLTPAAVVMNPDAWADIGYTSTRETP